MERYCDKGGGEGRIRRRGKRGGGRGKRGKYTSKNFPTIICMVDLTSQNLEQGKSFRAVLMTVQRSKQHLIMFRHQLVRVFHLKRLKREFFDGNQTLLFRIQFAHNLTNASSFSRLRAHSEGAAGGEGGAWDCEEQRRKQEEGGEKKGGEGGEEEGGEEKGGEAERREEKWLREERGIGEE